MLHTLVFVVTLSTLDMGFFYYYASGLWGALAILLAASTLRRVRTAEPEPDPYTRHTRPDFAKLRANRMPERKL